MLFLNAPKDGRSPARSLASNTKGRSHHCSMSVIGQKEAGETCVVSGEWKNFWGCASRVSTLGREVADTVVDTRGMQI